MRFHQIRIVLQWASRIWNPFQDELKYYNDYWQIVKKIVVDKNSHARNLVHLANWLLVFNVGQYLYIFLYSKKSDYEVALHFDLNYVLVDDNQFNILGVIVCLHIGYFNTVLFFGSNLELLKQLGEIILTNDGSYFIPITPEAGRDACAQVRRKFCAAVKIFLSVLPLLCKLLINILHGKSILNSFILQSTS